MSTENIVRSVCNMMAKAINYLEQEIAAKERQIDTLRARLVKLHSESNSDQVLIQEIKTDMQGLEDRLGTDRSQLTAFQEEFAASCGPRNK